MRDVLDQQLARFEELEKAMNDPEVQASGPKMAATMREHGSLAKVATKYRRFRELNQQIKQTQELANAEDDPEMRELAEAEVATIKSERDALWDELLSLTAAGEDAARTKCVLEIRAGTGGDEAALFARDLYDMYRKYAETRGWKVELLEASPTELGGFKEIILGLEGEGVFRDLRFESGGHRVQRVPETETKGRVHTSAATVAVMAEPEDIEIDLKRDDYREDTYCASGPGGQHVNKTASAIRLTHLATGIVVTCQDEKSQHKNRARALRVLKTRLYEHFKSQEDQKRSSERKTLVGSGDRSMRIRTYNFPENRVTDHRINLTLYKLDQIIAGNPQPVIDSLLDYERQELRSAMGAVE